MHDHVLPVKYQTALSAIGVVFLNFAQWIISVLLVRMDGYEAAGIFSLAMSISNVFAFFSNYGLRNYQITDTQKKFSDRQYLLARYELVIAAGLACSVYLLTASGYSRQEKWAIFLYLAYNLFNMVGDTLLGSIQIRNHLEINGYSCMAKGFVCLTAFLSAFWISHDVVTALAAMAIGSLIVVIFYDAILYRKYVPKSSSVRTGDWQHSLQLWPACFTLMLALVVPIVTAAIPRRTIQSLLGVDQLGVFSSIFTPTVIITTLTPTVLMAFLPRFASIWENGCTHQLRSMVIAGLGFFAGGTLLAFAAAFLCGRLVMRLLFGAEILEYFPLLYWAVLATVCSAVTSFFNGILTAIRRTGSIAVFTAGALLLTVLLTRPLVERFGIYGAAHVQIIVYGLQAVAQLVLFFLFTCRRS